MMLGDDFHFLDKGDFKDIDEKNNYIRDLIICKTSYEHIKEKFNWDEIYFKKPKISSLEITFSVGLLAFCAYSFVKDYTDLRSGLIQLAKDLESIGENLYPIFSNKKEMERRLNQMNRLEPRAFDDGDGDDFSRKFP